MTPEQAEALRKPFPPEQIGKLPKVNCKACVAANKQQFGSTCDKHQKSKCAVCGNWISSAHIHLDYVGHAATTDRLLQVDPEWTWEYAPEYPQGSTAGMWIRLTICGVTRPGFGDGPDPKQWIGDAIRNAAMRFGVALDLWSKEDLQVDDAEPGKVADVATPERIESLVARVRELGLSGWVKEQHYVWPWEPDVCDVIEKACDQKAATA